MKPSKIAAIFPVYLPWLLSVLLQLLPEVSYFIAWLGSFFIFYFTLRFPGRTLDPNAPRIQQIMRPIILLQFVFAGFMCCSSIFYFIDYLGYFSHGQTNGHQEPLEDQIRRIAECQRLCLLAHCALVTGMFWVSPQIRKRSYLLTVSKQRFLIILSVSSLLSAFLFSTFSGTKQIAILLSSLTLFSGTALFSVSIKSSHVFGVLLGSGLFLFSLSVNLFTGYKEAIIVHLILLTCLVYPLHPRAVMFFCTPIFMLVLVFLPSFTKHIRQHAWSERRKHAATWQVVSLYQFNQQPEELMHNNWEFLSNRFSEIGMFTKFIKKVPEERPYYGLEIFENAVKALVPRAFWPSKPNTEKIAMQRIYELGIANPSSSISAKSRPVVDGYLSGGVLGVFISMFIYGYLGQLICDTSIRWFGGDQLGCTVLFNGFFQQLWRGNNFEFILNNILYGVLLMASIFLLLRLFSILVPHPKKQTGYDCAHLSVL